MKLIALIVYVGFIYANAEVAEPIVDEKQCEVCSNFIDFIVDDLEESVPNQYIELLDINNFQEICVDGCGLSNNSDDDSDLSDNNDATSNIKLSEQNLIKLTGCDTCERILNVTAKYSHGYDFSSVKYSLRHACENIKGILDTVKCKLFIKLRESKILHALYKFKKDSHQSCVYLGQC